MRTARHCQRVSRLADKVIRPFSHVISLRSHVTSLDSHVTGLPTARRVRYSLREWSIPRTHVPSGRWDYIVLTWERGICWMQVYTGHRVGPNGVARQTFLLWWSLMNRKTWLPPISYTVRVCAIIETLVLNPGRTKSAPVSMIINKGGSLLGRCGTH